MNKKKVLAVFLSVTMVISIMSPMVFAAGDTAGHWAENAYNVWQDNGVLSGDQNGNANLDNPMTRGELAQVLVKTMGYKTAAANEFTDLNGQWYEDAILKCVAAGVISGYGNGTVGGDDPITREQSIVMLARALMIEPMATGGTAFADGSEVSSWALPYLNAMSAAGIVNGNPDGTVDPLADVSRGAVVVMLDNAVTTYVKAAGTYTNPDADGIIVIATSEEVIIDGAEAGTVIVAPGAENGKITLQNTTAWKVILSAAGADVSIDKASSVDSVKVEATADGIKINVAGGATIGTLNVDGCDITVTGDLDAIENQNVTNGGAINETADTTRPGGGGGSSSSGGGGGSDSGGGSEGSTDEKHPAIVIGDTKYEWDPDEKEYVTGDGDEKEYISAGDLKEELQTAIGNGQVITIDGKEYVYSQDLDEWFDIIGDPEEKDPVSGSDLQDQIEEQIGGTQESEPVD